MPYEDSSVLYKGSNSTMLYKASAVLNKDSAAL